MTRGEEVQAPPQSLSGQFRKEAERRRARERLEIELAGSTAVPLGWKRQ